MNNYDNSGKGALWSNQMWTPGDKGPKWTGKLTADRDIKMGEEIPLSVWPAERKGEKSPVMRLQVNRWKEKQETAKEGEKMASKPAEQDWSDKIPF